MNPFSRIINIVVFWSLLGVIALAVFPYGSVDAWWETTFECSVFLLTAVWIVGAIFARDWQIRRVSVLLPMIATTAYAFVQAIQWPPAWLNKSATQHMLSIDHYQTYITARKSLALTLFLGLLLAHTSTLLRFRWVVRAVIGIGLVSALLGILRQFLQLPDSEGFLLPLLFYGTGYGQFISPNAFAYLMELTLGLLAGVALGGGVRKNRVLIYLAIIAIVFAALVLSNSRGGLLGFACESVFMLFVALSWYAERRLARGGEPNQWLTFFRASKLVRFAVIAIVLITLSVGVLWIGGDRLANKLADQTVSNQDNSDGATRQEIWRASWKLFKNSPWTGTGFGAYFLGIPQFETSSGRIKLEQAHNDYLDLAASGGLIGLAAGAWFIAVILWQAKRSFAVRNTYQRAAALGAATGILGVGVHSFVDFGLQLTGIAIVFGASVVILAADVPMEAARSRHRNGGPRRSHDPSSSSPAGPRALTGRNTHRDL